MTGRAEIEARLKEIGDEKRLYVVGGQIIEGFEDEYAHLCAEEKELLHQLQQHKTVEQLRKQLQVEHEALQDLELTKSKFGLLVPIQLSNEIRERQRRIEELEKRLAEIEKEVSSVEEPKITTPEVMRFMQQAARELAAEHYGVALTLLSRALAWAEPAEEPLIERRIDEVQRRQMGRARALEREFRHTLKAAEPDLEKAERLLLHLEQVAPSWPRLVALRMELERHLEQRAAKEKVNQVRCRLEELWRSGSLSDATEALRIAQAEAAENPDILALQGLIEEAHQKRQEAAEREEGWLTAAQLGRFKNLLEAWDTMIELGTTELPWYEWVQGRLTQTGYAPAEQAREHLYLLAVSYEDAKAEERLAAARNLMPHSPRAAERQVREALAFEYISGVVRYELQNFLAQAILPAIEKRESAERALAVAKVEIDAYEAWRMVKSIELLDPHAPSLETTKQAVLPRLRQRIEADIRALQVIKTEVTFMQVYDRFAELRALVIGEPSLADLEQRLQALYNKHVEVSNSSAKRVDI